MKNLCLIMCFKLNEPCSAISISLRPYSACFIRRTAKSVKPDAFFYNNKRKYLYKKTIYNQNRHVPIRVC
jgi:hypothetical protein